MNKIAFTDNSGRWFDRNSAKKFRPASYTDSQTGQAVCRATNHPCVWETLYLTRSGDFVIVRSSDDWPEVEAVEEIEVKDAVKWLITNGHQEEVKKMDLASEEKQLEV